MSELAIKIKSKTAMLGVIGLGYVGLPLAVEKAKAGFVTTGYDIQASKVEMVNAGVNYIGDVVNEDLNELVTGKFLRATIDISDVMESDCICICVPTPLDKHQQPDLSYIKVTAENIARHLRRDMLIVLESTTYPGTTEEFLKPILESSGLRCGEDFYLAFSPERVDPGNLIYKTKNTPKVVGGVTATCLEIASIMYEMVLDAPVHKVSSPRIAEMEKILENTYRNVNIGLVNELTILCNKMGINIWEVIEAAKSKPYGFQAFYPGAGVGGHCIPLDPYYLSWKAREYGFHTSMIESAMIINDRMPEYCAERASKILNRFKKPLNGSRILVLGVAYKQDIDDYRESPSIRLIDELEKLGSEVVYYDQFISRYFYSSYEKLGLIELEESDISCVDLVIVATSHSNVDYDMVQRNAKYVFDIKNAMKDVQNRENIELL